MKQYKLPTLKDPLVKKLVFDIEKLQQQLERAENLLFVCRKKQELALRTLRKNDFVFDDLEDKWQKLAFSFYTDLCEIEKSVEHYFQEKESQ